MKIYTKTGDCGKTSLYGGKRVHKDSMCIRACGDVDELSAVLGMCMSMLGGDNLAPPARPPNAPQTDSAGTPGKNSPAPQTAPHSGLSPILKKIQHVLFIAGADLAAPPEIKTERIKKSDITEIEKLIDRHEAALPPLKNFILPGGAPAAAHLHLARTVCRRAEREVAALQKQEKINPLILPYLNRLSDLFFVLARHTNKISGACEEKWSAAAPPCRASRTPRAAVAAARRQNNLKQSNQ
jgi:cob(I)alamin adenosyltransferase